MGAHHEFPAFHSVLQKRLVEIPNLYKSTSWEKLLNRELCHRFDIFWLVIKSSSKSSFYSIKLKLFRYRKPGLAVTLVIEFLPWSFLSKIYFPCFAHFPFLWPIPCKIIQYLTSRRMNIFLQVFPWSISHLPWPLTTATSLCWWLARVVSMVQWTNTPAVLLVHCYMIQLHIYFF